MATYGIDLGTTNSCIAYVDDTGRPVVLKSAVGEDTTPSVVYFESPENVVVGRQAKDSAVLAPDLVAELVKRQMGQDVHYTFHGQAHTPESISALILRELARAAQEQTGEEVRDVVITVPAYFGVLERDATRKAGEIAGLNVLDVLAEPVAAALEYQALGEHTGVRHIFVYDLGGGTFDTTVIRLEGDDVTVVCTDGNHQLGGADWDARIIDFLLRGFTDQYPDLDPSGDEQFMQDLATSAEQLKKALSATLARKHNVRFDGRVAQLELTREQLEEITSELLERTMEITERTIATAREKGVEHFDDVLLVGGMTIMPAITQTLQERFGLQARQQDPHLAVAKGAALFALMRKVKVSMPGEGAGPRRRWPTSWGSPWTRLRPWPPGTWRRSCRVPSGSRSSTPMTRCSRPTAPGPAGTSRTCSRRTRRCPPTPGRRPSARSPTTSARSSWRSGSRPDRSPRRSSSTTPTSARACSGICRPARPGRRSRSSST